MAVRVVTEDTPLIKVTGVASPSVSSSVFSVNTVNVSQSNSVVKVPSLSSSTIEINPLSSVIVNVEVPEVRPFKAVIFQGPKGDPGLSADGSSVLTENITVTETQGSAQENSFYPALTSLEDIVRDMLSEFVIPVAEITSAPIGTLVNGVFVESQDRNFDYGTNVYLKDASFILNTTDNIYGGNLGVIFFPVKFTNKKPGSSVWSQNLFPLFYPEDSDWSNFLEEQNVTFNNSPVLLSSSPDIGEGSLRTEFAYTKTGSDLHISNSYQTYRVGKYIRCYTSVAADLRGSNISNVLGSTVNVYDPSQSDLLSLNLEVETNELKFSDFIYDFDTEEREIIVSFSPGDQDVSDENRYLVIELPNEFYIDEAAATTAGSGVYSLNDSIVYLGNSFSDPGNTPYTVNGNHVKYYRSRIPGAFDGKIKLDLKIKLDN